MCLHSKQIDVYMKHNDLAGISADHLDLCYDGYMPNIGIFGGDETNLKICCDCGYIIGWKPLTDKKLLKHLENPNKVIQNRDDDSLKPTFDVLKLIREGGKATQYLFNMLYDIINI